MFTFDLQFQRNRTGTTSDPVNMPDGSGAAAEIFRRIRPFTIPLRERVPGNKIPASRISATATAVEYFPEPICVAGAIIRLLERVNNSYNLKFAGLEH